MSKWTRDPIRLLERAADIYDLRATEFDSMGEPCLESSVRFNEERAKLIRALLTSWMKGKKPQ